RVLGNLLDLKPASFEASTYKIEDLIAPQAMGNRNTVYQLQNYVVGLSQDALVLKADSSIDEEKSFIRVNYFSLLHGVVVRNNVQSGVSNRPIDLIATRLPATLVEPLISENNIDRDVIWVYDGQDNQLLILARTDGHGGLSLKCQPIRDL